MSSVPPGPPQEPDDDAFFFQLERYADRPAPPPAVEGMEARMKDATDQIGSFTKAAQALETDLANGVPGAGSRVATTLDQARAWVTYLAPDGPLAREIPPHVPVATAMGYLTRIAECGRLAQAWVDFFVAAGREKSTQQQAAAQDEQAFMRRVQEGEQAVNAQTMAFTLNSSNVNSYQMQGSINELNALLATLQSWRPTANSLIAAGHPAGSERLEQLIQHLQSQLQMFRSMWASKRAFEASQGW